MYEVYAYPSLSSSMLFLQVLVEKSPDGSCRPQELHGNGKDGKDAKEDRRRANSVARAGGQVSLQPTQKLILVLSHRLVPGAGDWWLLSCVPLPKVSAFVAWLRGVVDGPESRLVYVLRALLHAGYSSSGGRQILLRHTQFVCLGQPSETGIRDGFPRHDSFECSAEVEFFSSASASASTSTSISSWFQFLFPA